MKTKISLTPRSEWLWPMCISLTPRFSGVCAARDLWQPFQRFLIPLALSLLLPLDPISAATNDLSATLQKGLFEEEANHNLSAAIQAYQAVINQLDDARKLAATAVFRLGECYRKQGKTNEALAQYERITRDFSDQATLVTLSRQTLLTLGVTPATPAGPLLSDAARQEQKRLLEEEIKLVEKKLSDEQKKVSVGQPNELLATQRELLSLKRQLVALDVGAPTLKEAEPSSTPSSSSEADEIKRIQAMIKDSPDLINSMDGSQTPLYAAAQKGQLRVAEFLLANGAAVSKGSGGRTPLHAAVLSGNKEMVELLLAHGADVNERESASSSSLHLAAGAGLKTMAEVLLAHKADVNAKDKDDRTPLHHASQRGFKSVAELLLAKGANVNARDKEQRTPLSLAVERQQFDLAKLFLANKAEVNAARTDGATPLHIAVAHAATAMVELLLSKNAEVNAQDKTGETPLHSAASRGDIDTIELLLTHKANINAKDRDGATPLVHAMTQRQWSAAKLLVEKKADLNFACNPRIPSDQGGGRTIRSSVPGGFSGPYNQRNGLYPVHIAMAVDNDDVLELLLKNGADPDVKAGDSGYAALHWAIGDGRIDRVELLLKYKANPNLRLGDTTPLLRAIQNQPSRKEIVEALLAHGADPNGKDVHGNVPLIIAAANGSKEMVQSLLAHKADVNIRGGGGSTPLHVAVSNVRKDIIELLLADGADPNLTDNQGKTPLALVKPSNPTYPVALPARQLSQFPGSSPEPRASQTEISDLLLKHGALEEPPDPSSVRITRKGSLPPKIAFKNATNSLNRFSLLEVVCNYYAETSRDYAQRSGQLNLLSLGGQNSSRLGEVLTRFGGGSGALQFPDFSAIKIHRQTGGKSDEQKEITVNLLAPTGAVQCEENTWLEFGDVVEVPEREHTLAEQPAGLTASQTRDLRKCLERKVTFIVKGQRTEISLGGFTDDSYLSKTLNLPEVQSILRTSSDLSNIEVKRSDPITKKELKLSVKPKASPDDLWLRDGDVIEVPDKT